MEFTYYGHACFSLKIKEKYILFDPFISYNELAKNIDINTIPADYILVSHGHEDHVADLVAIASRTGAKVVSSWEMIQWVGKQGIENTHPMNTGGQWTFDFGIVRCTIAQHSSSVPDGSYGGNPMGFLLKTDEGNIYYSGDTALTLDMKLIPKYWAKQLKAAIFPIGDNFTMGYEDVIIAADLVKCKKIIGVHFDTFGFIKIDHQTAKKAFADDGKELILPNIGQTIYL